GCWPPQLDEKLLRQMRHMSDVVLVGADTVRREGYGLVRLSDEAKAQREANGKPPTPPVAVVSGSLQLNWNLKLFKDAPDHAPTMIITAASADPDKVAEAKQHATVITAGEERVDPAAVLQALADRGHRVVLCEGGPTLLGEFVAAERLDELCLSIA